MLDAAVLVVSGVEGVQPQTVVLWRALRRLQVPTVVFVNKLDRPGADLERVAAQLRRRLAAPLVVLATADGMGSPAVRVRPVAARSRGRCWRRSPTSTTRARPLRWPAGLRRPARCFARCARRSRARAITPLVCGSAITGAGADELRQVLHLLPRAGRTAGPLAASVFAVDRDERGRRAWLRIWRGELRVRTAYGAGQAAARSGSPGSRVSRRRRARRARPSPAGRGRRRAWAAGVAGGRRARRGARPAPRTGSRRRPCTRTSSPAIPTRRERAVRGADRAGRRGPAHRRAPRRGRLRLEPARRGAASR